MNETKLVLTNDISSKLFKASSHFEKFSVQKSELKHYDFLKHFSVGNANLGIKMSMDSIWDSVKAQLKYADNKYALSVWMSSLVPEAWPIYTSIFSALVYFNYAELVYEKDDQINIKFKDKKSMQEIDELGYSNLHKKWMNTHDEPIEKEEKIEEDFEIPSGL